MKDLIIVESPTKAKTISRFLGKDYIVEASFGHVRDLPKSKLSIAVENNFTPTYIVPPKAKEHIKTLKEKAQHASSIILATDEDREGEAIAWHLVQALDLGDEHDIAKDKKDKRIKRIVFHEITPSAIEHALHNPRDLDLNLVDAQQARRVLDRLVGYELSPFLWHKIRYGLSAGRVQSVAVRLIVEREREIQNFKQEEYWSIEAKLSTLPSPNHEEGARRAEEVFTAKLFKIGDKTVGKMDIKNQQQAQGIVQQLAGAHYRVADITKKEVTRNPAPPFTTSTLQQEAARKFGMSAKQTMVIAQQLYEGITLGAEGSTGLITYMRTDSLNLAESALKQAQEVISEHFGKQYGLDKPRYYSNKSKNAQEAHEAIRPTDLSRHPKAIAQYLDRGQQRVYDLIWKRTIASQMSTAVFDHTTVEIDATSPLPSPHEGRVKGGVYKFKATGQVVKFDGFIKAYTEGTDETPGDQVEGALPELTQDEPLKLHQLLPLQHFTEPPGRYTDATLIKALETHGVGRPSTYAPTLSTIQERDYVEKIDKKYHPTEIGILVNDMLVENFPEIVDINFTSHIEEELDEIATGERKWVPVIAEFYRPFKKHLVEKEATVEKQVEISTTPCPHCSQPMLIKFGRMGKFLACPEPGSKVTLPMPEESAKIKELEEKTKDERCSLCGKPMQVKRGRFGFFLGCSDYPKCKGISKIWNKLGFKCPNCLARHSPRLAEAFGVAQVGEGGSIGDIVEKKSRGRGKPFYACTRYPECNFIINKKPESQEELMELYKNWKAQPRTGATASSTGVNPPKPKAPRKKK